MVFAHDGKNSRQSKLTSLCFKSSTGSGLEVIPMTSPCHSGVKVKANMHTTQGLAPFNLNHTTSWEMTLSNRTKSRALFILLLVQGQGLGP